MSDFQKVLKKIDTKKEIQGLEKKEQAEGVRNALQAGRGNVVAGAKKLGMKKPGLAAAEKKAVMKTGKARKK